ncbi:serine/threonine protein kinase with PASTA sensor(S) [Clostridium sp. CAG:492]|nr:serine/threonine protein kinase with PASTA sensor(S) [Clostridium sp. CAG:492]
MNLEGSVIGNRYKIQEKIGNGGMATVYKALDQILNRYVAVKVLREEFTTDEEFIKRFNAEAQSAARLTHPNIVSVYDVGQEYNIYYIVMELIQGKTLKQIIEEDGHLSWKWAVNIAIQIASALEMAHKNNIIHRDIKPHNIMITEDGVAKVTDFGIAKAVSNSTITAFGTTLGSVHYFSPEHARGGYTDSKSDLYSLGVVMYEMVTGKVPFDADTPVSIALKHMQEEPVPPMKVNKEIPFAVNQIILKAMKKDPNERYQNASEMIKDLNIALKRPEGGFVEERNFEDSFTRRIPTVNVSDNRNGNIKSDNEEEKPKGKIATFFYNHPKTKVASIIALFVLIFVATLVITLTVINSSSPKDVQIPNVVNLTQEEAKQRIEQLKLKFAYKEEYSADVEAGHVISQDPQYINNYSVKEGSTVTVVISKGMEQTKVPKVIGMEYSKAESALTEAGLEVEKVEETSQKVEAGYVISQEIDANTEVQKGTKIKIHVSTGTGIKKVTVTSVIGKSSEEAKKILTDLKLEVNVVEDEDTSKSDGVVLKQSVDPGTSVEEGSAITITVNKIEKNKQGTVNINVKALANRHLPKSSGEEEDNTTTTSNNVKITVMVGSDKVYSQKVSRDTEKLNVTVEGKGNITVKVYIANEDESSNGILAKNATIDLNSENTVLNVD